MIKKTQKDAILEMLKDGPVTPMTALSYAGCYRLAARIFDLRRDGHDISRTEDADGHTVYQLEKLACSP